VLPLRKSANESIGSLIDTNSSLLFPVLFAVFFWIALTGLSIPQSIIALAILAFVGVWGLLLTKLLAPSLLHQSDLPLWLFGPCIGIGAMSLFLLRLVTSELIFLTIFLLVPAIWIVFSVRAVAKKPHCWGDRLSALKNMMTASLFFIGLVGVILITGWDWAAPITAVSLLAAVFMSIDFVRARFASILLFVCLLPTSWWAIHNRNQTWWMHAEGIPFDETILETISKGLIRWGPGTSPLNVGLDGASAAAYHHLVYIIIGLIDRFVRPGPYEALLILAPIVSGVSICISLVLLVRVLHRRLNTSLGFSPLVIGGLVACLFGLPGEGFGSPSNWFGIAALIANLLLIVGVSENAPDKRKLFLVAISVITIAFSKFIFIYAAVLIAFSFALFNSKKLWKIAITALVASVLVFVWFSWASIPADQFVFGFWPYRNWQSRFALDFYTFRVFIKQLVSPVVLGVTCAVILQRSKHILLRQINLSMVAILVAAIASQLVITSTGPRSFELFYLPGIIAAALLYLTLVVSNYNLTRPTFWRVAVVFVLALGVVKYSPPLGSGTISPFTIATTLIGTFLGVNWLIQKFGIVGTRYRAKSSIPLVSVFLILVATMTLASQDFPKFPQYARTPVTVQLSNWFGSPEFIEVTDFIQKETSSTSLFALSICDPNSDQTCNFDFRPAALFGRRWLASEPLFSRNAVGDGVWSDIELSKAIGVFPPNEVIEALSVRGVNYVFIDLSKVDIKWVRNLKSAGALEVFSNSSYFVFQLRTN
jgi:hypothetical protein